MMEQSFSGEAQAGSYHDRAVLPGVRPFVSHLAIVVAICLTLVLGTALLLLRLTPIPSILNLPEVYRPGAPPPRDLSCQFPAEEGSMWRDLCGVRFQEQQVYLEFDADGRQILRSIIPVRDYTLGDLVVSWGRPHGVNWNRSTIYVYWQVRWAILDRMPLRPESPIQTILYTVEQPASSPWRGFWS
jgi:hypothetical protein